MNWRNIKEPAMLVGVKKGAKMEHNELKPCTYCHDDSEGYFTAHGAFWISHSVHEGYLLHAGKCKPRPIKYCFMCGRKLNDGT